MSDQKTTLDKAMKAQIFLPWWMLFLLAVALLTAGGVIGFVLLNRPPSAQADTFGAPEIGITPLPDELMDPTYAAQGASPSLDTPTPTAVPLPDAIQFVFGPALSEDRQQRVREWVAAAYAYYLELGGDEPNPIMFYVGGEGDLDFLVDAYAQQLESAGVTSSDQFNRVQAARDSWLGFNGTPKGFPGAVVQNIQPPWGDIEDADGVNSMATALFLAIQYDAFGPMRDPWLAGPQARAEYGPAWMNQGSAVYFGIRAAAAAGVLDFEDARLDFLVGFLPDPYGLVPSPLFLESGVQLGDGLSSGNLGAAFYAVNMLVKDRDDQSLVAYYKAIKSGLLWEDAFKQTFGITHQEFYAQIDPDWLTLVPTRLSGTARLPSGASAGPTLIRACADFDQPESCRFTRTTASGFYTFFLPEPGTFKLEFATGDQHGYYSDAGIVANAGDATPVTVTDAPVTGINFLFDQRPGDQPLRMISGKLIDANGDPIANVSAGICYVHFPGTFSAYNCFPGGNSGVKSAVHTQADGSFVIEAPDNDLWVLIFSYPDAGSADRGPDAWEYAYAGRNGMANRSLWGQENWLFLHGSDLTGLVAQVPEVP